MGSRRADWYSFCAVVRSLEAGPWSQGSSYRLGSGGGHSHGLWSSLGGVWSWLFARPQHLESAGKTEEATRVREEALEELQELRSIGMSYVATRATMPSGWERTMRMERDFDKARQQARMKPPSHEQLERLLRGDDGERITALAAIKERPDVRDLIVDAAFSALSRIGAVHSSITMQWTSQLI